MNENNITYSEETKKQIEEFFQESISHIYPDGIPDGSILLNLNATIYLPYKGDIEGNVTFYDKNGQQLEILLPTFRVGTPYQNRKLHILATIGKKSFVYKNGIPIIIERDQAELIRKMKIVWNINNGTFFITMTELCDLTIEFTDGKERVYELCTKIKSLFDLENIDKDLDYEIEYLSQYDNYCICFTQHPLQEMGTRKIIRFPLSKRQIEMKRSFLEKRNKVTNILNDLELYAYCPQIKTGGTLIPNSQISEEELANSLILEGLDKDMYFKGIKQNMYKLVVSKRTAHLLPEKAPYESFLYS